MFTINNIEDFKSRLESFNVRGYSIGAHTAIIFFYSPVTECIEERHMWSMDPNECTLWLETVETTYSDLEFSYRSYLNYDIHSEKGNLF